MSGRVRITVSIVISAVLLGLVISYLKRSWMPTETFDWVMWVAMALVGAYAIYRIATLTKAWSGRVRITVSIVISAVLLGLVISYLKRRWMPTETFDWVMWVVMALVGAYATYRIATLSKAMSNNDKDKE